MFIEGKYSRINVGKVLDIIFFTEDSQYHFVERRCVRMANNKSKERDDTMAAFSKPINGAFVLSNQKASEFLKKKVNTSSDAIRRFENRKANVASNKDR